MGVQLQKQVVKVGNSAGIILPKAWLNGTAVVELVKEPLDVNKDIFDLLKDNLADVKGIYLTGSYARGDFDSESDVDVLVITESVKANIRRGKYDLLLIPYGDLKKMLKTSIFPIFPMIKESIPILNKELILSFKDVKMDGKLVQKKINNIKDSIAINEGLLELCREAEQNNVEDGIVYSLVLRMRELYILSCLKRGRGWNKKGFIKLIKDVSESVVAYDGYINVKNNNKKTKKLSVDDAEKILNYLKKEVKKWEGVRS